MTTPNVTFSIITWWEKEKDTRTIKYAARGAIWLAFLGIIIAVSEGATIERAAIIIIGLASLGAFFGAMGIDFEDKYLFGWNDVPGSENIRLIELIGQKFGVDWVKIADI